MRFAGAKEGGKITVVGIPYEGVLSGLPGTREGPHYVRRASYLLESYVPELDVDLQELPFVDMGDVELFGPPERVCGEVEEIVTGVGLPVLIGGDHSITVGAVKALRKRYGRMEVLYFDAHLDLRDEFGESTHSHACSAARIAETGTNIRFFGVRSGTREEWRKAGKMKVFGAEDDWPRNFSDPIYITVDMDVFDPAFAPGVGTAEPAGITPAKFFKWLHGLEGRIIGFDVVETNPLVENKITPVLAAKIVRDAIAKIWMGCVAEKGKDAPAKGI